MTAKEVYRIMKALDDVTGPEESVKVIRDFVEKTLDGELNGKPSIPSPSPYPIYPSTPNLPDWGLTDPILTPFTWGTVDIDVDLPTVEYGPDGSLTYVDAKNKRRESK